jgi:uncharacterized short protein YbdD (DUF466 family)
MNRQIEQIGHSMLRLIAASTAELPRYVAQRKQAHPSSAVRTRLRDRRNTPGDPAT